MGYKRVGHGYMHADLVQAACTFEGPKKYSQAKDRERWYGQPNSLLAQTLQELKRKYRQEKLVFKLPKN
jgi:hypothetical protein